MENAIPPTLQPGEKIHYPIFHDECCVHANGQCAYVWAREGEQPLRDKSRGCIVHISNFVIEHSGRLVLWEFEREAQDKLPQQPEPPAPPTTDVISEDLISDSILVSGPSTSGITAHSEPWPVPTPSKHQTKKTTNTKPKKPKKTKAPKPKKVKRVVATRRTLAKPNDWVPPLPPAPFESYRILSYDARQIIYPGVNHDPWWDMPQLIAQVSQIRLHVDYISLTNDHRPSKPSRFLM